MPETITAKSPTTGDTIKLRKLEDRLERIHTMLGNLNAELNELVDTGALSSEDQDRIERMERLAKYKLAPRVEITESVLFSCKVCADG